MTFDSSGQISAYEGNPILLNNTYAKDPNLQESVLNYKNRVSAKMDTVIGSTLAFIDGSRPKCRLEECSFGNFATDAMKTEMNVEIALCNSGGIRGSLQPNGMYYIILNELKYNRRILHIDHGKSQAVEFVSKKMYNVNMFY